MARPIQDVVDNYVASVNRVDKQAMQRLVESYSRVYADIKRQAEMLILDVSASGKPMTGAAIMRLDRYKNLMADMRRELGRYGVVVDDVVAVSTSAAATAGARSMEQLILNMFPPEAQASIAATLGRMPAEAVKALVGALQAESPLASVTLARYGETAAQQMSKALISGMVQGIGARKTAAQILASVDPILGVPLTKALTIARTEANRAFRQASRASMRTNPHIVKGWTWYANINGTPEPCLACLAMHGSEHTMNETLNDHPNGRCVMMPITPTFRELGFDVDEAVDPVPTGKQVFDGLPEARQRAIMGGTRYDAYKAGKFDFADMAMTRHSDEWGDTIAIAPISG